MTIEDMTVKEQFERVIGRKYRDVARRYYWWNLTPILNSEDIVVDLYNDERAESEFEDLVLKDLKLVNDEVYYLRKEL